MPRRNQPLRSLPPNKIWWLWLCIQYTPSIKRGWWSCTLFSRHIEPMHILFDWKKKKIWICGEPVYVSQYCVPLPQAPNTAQDRARIWKISILVLHWDVKTLLWRDADTSGINNLGQITYDSIWEQNHSKEDVGPPYVMWCEGIHRNVPLQTQDSALQST